MTTTGYVLDAVRTPRGRGKAGKGSLSGIHPQELFAQLLVALERRNGFGPARVDDDELERLDRETALVAMCTAGGQGIATILERLR